MDHVQLIELTKARKYATLCGTFLTDDDIFTNKKNGNSLQTIQKKE